MISFIIFNGEGKKLHYGIGASTNLDSNKAIDKALKECLFTYYYSLNIMDLRKNNPDEISTLYEHFLYYQGELFEELLFESEKVKYTRELYTFDDVKKDLKIHLFCLSAVSIPEHILTSRAYFLVSVLLV